MHNIHDIHDNLSNSKKRKIISVFVNENNYD